ncbi:CLUMA_CG006813, isoform A [Clunio marinus]|uniref:CLUMA_CG006813, isoform A n=1 Tax=Clunio marinus TaxID=568069 RepID=A0A1J1I347_9DIPT|nr:CLUMA_CG006813, isoform A [Clunio marinus]
MEEMEGICDMNTDKTETNFPCLVFCLFSISSTSRVKAESFHLQEGKSFRNLYDIPEIKKLSYKAQNRIKFN